jgi:hypothetical protein
MFKLIGISLIFAVIQISESAPVYQFLPHREGYVPVYIRLGDTPLDEINPDLALAFHESSLDTNANELEEMLNDAPANDDISESFEYAKKTISVQEDASSEEELKSEISDNKETSQAPQQKNSTPDHKSEEENNSEEEPASPKSSNEKDSDEIIVSLPKNKPEPNDDSSEDVTKSRQTVSPAVATPTKSNVEDSSEEDVGRVTETQASTFDEIQSSEENH